MASVFLSYAREDAPKAQALAKSLECAAHSVWWDRHIHGGSEYSGEIEAALKRSDVVIVLWSEASARSAWVRDEAADGRDRGRLVPLLLDSCTPPLGFRQLQSISIAGWSGRGNPPHWQELLAAIDAQSGAQAAARAAEKPDRRRAQRPVLVAFAAVVALALAIGSWLLIGGRSEAAEQPVLAVLPFSDLSPEGDKGYFAEGVAEAILTVLAKEPGINVLGRSTAEQLQNAGEQSQEMRRALGVTHVVEGSARSAGNQLRMSVRLISAADGRQIWAEEYQRRLDNVFAVQDEIGRAVAERLKGSFNASGATQAQTSADAYTLYLAARAKMRDRELPSLRDALRTARKVLAADPNYAPGHAIYAKLVWHLSAENYGTIPPKQARAIADRHARRAIQLAPEAADGYAALGVFSKGKVALDALSKAIRLDPARAELRLWMADEYERMGRHEEALEQLTAGLEMEPLWWPLAARHAYLLAASGHYGDAEAAISKFERNGGSAGISKRVRADIAGYYKGDYSEAVRLGRAALAADPQTPLASGNLAIAYYMVGMNSAARPLAADFPTYSRLSLAGERQRLLAQVRQDGARIWEQADPDIAIEALAADRDWAALEALFDANREATSLVCSDHRRWTVQMGLYLAQALQVRGRQEESRALLTCLDRILAIHRRAELRSPYLPDAAILVVSAQLEALRARPDRAFAFLSRSMEQGFRTAYGEGLSDLPAFDAFQTSEYYRRLDARLKGLAAQDRAQTLALPGA